ncbi:MAG: PKD domain-containing protein [Rubrivivax sp.]
MPLSPRSGTDARCAARRGRPTRSLLATAAMLAVGASIGIVAVPAAAQGRAASTAAPRAKPPFPALRLPQARAQGARAVELLGERLPEVAAWYGKSPDEFRALLLNDRRLRIDRQGRLFVEEELDHPLPADPASAAPSGALDGTLAPLAQTYLLHSRPGAKRTIYLNFRGAVLSNTAWNGSSGTITAPPFDLDGVPFTNSTAELERIQYIWQRVAEDYAPFDVDVTTEPPPPEALTRSGSGDDVFGTTVLITTKAGVYSCSCGGVAYIGIFDDSDTYKPALVFYDALGNGNEKYVAEAISHEAGHNMGLLHDGYSGGGYYQGQGSGTTGWAPIMGVGYYQALVQWSKGEYATANNTQDDYVVMGQNGLPLRADDHGGTLASATPLATSASGGAAVLAGDGVIERPGDVDTFSFVAGAGSATFNVVPAWRSGNADLKIELRNGAGSLLASANAVDALSAAITTTLPAAGSYYLAVTGVGKGDPLTTGYTAYGSTGQYGVSGLVPATGGAGQPPTAILSATPTSGTVPLTVAFSAAGSSDPDGSIVGFTWTFGDGGSASGATASHTYQSAGTFTAQLRVTDDSGLSATRSTTITVAPVVATPPMRVTDIGLSLASAKGGKARAIAAVAVRAGNGQPVVGASVSGRWSGIVSGTVSGSTSSTGVVRLNSPLTRSGGTFTFTVTGVALGGYAYQPADNVETSDSITR